MESKVDTHLGKRVEYKDQYDKSLLVPINRAERRTEYKHKMIGEDIWTAFEVSFLNLLGQPEYYVLRISNPADSINIFESKSFKLYLNSFNNTKFKNLEGVKSIIQRDLSELAGGTVKVTSIKKFRDNIKSFDKYKDLLKLCSKVKVDEYTYNPKLLKTFGFETETKFYTDLLRTNCEITNQPDWGRLIISYEPNKSFLDLESFFKYIISYRKRQEFHEPTCERIYQDLTNLLEPKELIVICQYTRRGGIDINPVRSSSQIYLTRNIGDLQNLPKILQQ